MSVSSPHIPFEQLIDLVEARLLPEEREAVQTHVAGCPFCQAEVAWLEWAIKVMRSDRGEDVPQHLTADAVALFAAHRPVAPPGQRSRVYAVLLFDSARQPFVVGIRAVGSDARQLLFSAASYEVDVRIVPSGSLWVVWGQLLGTEETGTVELQDAEQDAEMAVQATLNELNEFSLAPVPAGVYTLTIALNDVDLEITDIQIGL